MLHSTEFNEPRWEVKTMGRKKQEPKEPRPDQHTSTLLVRFPEEMRAVFQAIKDKLGQPYPVAATRAVLAYAKANGIDEKLSGN
jgi:hypothetical protein